MKKTLPKISIITPSFNQAEYIETTIQSVLSQNYPNLEYIVVDGASTDNTIEILSKYNRYIKWTSKKDKGQTDAINKGIKESTGQIIAYLNSDDTYLPNTLHTVAEFFENNSYMWVTGKCKIVNNKGEKVRSVATLWKNIWLKTLDSGLLKDGLYILNFISQPATFWTRDVVKNIGYFDESLKYTMDYDYWLRIFKKYKPKVIDKNIATFRVHAESKGVTRTKAQFQEGYEVAKRYCTRKNVLKLHKIHDRWTEYLYNT